jgi:hypothetical protein
VTSSPSADIFLKPLDTLAEPLPQVITTYSSYHYFLQQFLLLDTLANLLSQVSTTFSSDHYFLQQLLLFHLTQTMVTVKINVIGRN